MQEITDPNLLAELNGGAPQPTAVPGFIPGRPKPVDPYKVRDQQIAEAKEDRAAAEFNNTGGPGTEAEKKIATLTTRIAGGLSDITGVLKEAPDAAGPGFVEGIRGDLNPGGITGMVSRSIAGAPRRAVVDAQRDVLDALLTLGTGAAYAPEQLSAAVAAHFPQYGDTADEKKIKQQRFERAVASAKANAGPAWLRVEPLIQPYLQGLTVQDGTKAPEMAGDVPVGTTVEVSMNSSDGDQPYNRNNFLEQRGLDPNKEATMVAFWNSNRGNEGLTPAGALRFYAENNIPPPNDADLNKMIEQAQQGLQFGPVDTSADEAAYRAELEQGAARMGDAGYTEKADQGLLYGGSDEFVGVGGAISSLVRGDDPRLGYQFSRDVMRLQNEKADENTGFMGDAVEVISGFAAPLGAVNSVRSAAKVGGIAGTVGGFGYGEGAQGSALGAAVGTGAGITLGAGGARLGNYLSNRASTRVAQNINRNALYTAAEDLGMTQPARMFTEPAEYAKTRAVSGTVVGSNPIQEGVQKFGDEIQTATTNALAQGKQPLERPTAGTMAQEAFNRTNEAKKTQTDNLYAAYQKASGDPAVMPKNALATIDQEIADLARSPQSNKSEIAFLQEYRDDLANGKMTVQTIRDMRTNLRGRINEKNLGMTKAEGRIQGVLDAAADDIAVTLDPKSKGFKLLTEANKSHADRVLYKKQLKADLIGKDSDLPTDPGKAFETILTWTNPKGDLRKLKALQASFTPDEASDFAATVVNSISKDNNGNFSTAILLQKIEQLERAGKNTIETLFGPDGSKAINNLKILAAEHKRVNGATAGQGSAFGNDWRSILTSVFAPAVVAAAGEGGVSLTTAAVGIGGLVIKAGRDAISAKMLLSPKVTGWVRSAPKTSDPKIIDAHFAKLGVIAKAQPALAADIKAFRDAIFQAANDNTNRAVAQDGQSEGGR